MSNLEFLNDKLSNFLNTNNICIFDIYERSTSTGLELTISLFKKNDYLTSDECQIFHQSANDLFKELNDYKTFVMEVRSVGINTIIKNDYQLELVKNLIISCKLIVAINNFYVIDGLLTNFDEQFIYLSNKVSSEIKVNRSNIKEIKIDK